MASAWVYDMFMLPLERAGLWRARKRLVRDLRGRVLELGAGTGLLLVVHTTPPAAAIDVDLEVLRRARKRAPSVPLVCADAQALPFRDGTFDAVVESLTLCSVPEPQRAVSEARRVLRPGGELRLLDHVRPPGRLGKLFDALAPAWLRISGGCHLERPPPSLEGFTEPGVRYRAKGIMCELRARREQ